MTERRKTTERRKSETERGRREANGISVVRSIDRIQLAHDVIEFMGGDTSKVGIMKHYEQQIAFVSLHELLCWILCHPNGNQFEQKFKLLLEQLKNNGVEFKPDKTAARFDSPGANYHHN